MTPQVIDPSETGEDLVREAKVARVPVEDHVKVVLGASDGGAPAVGRHLRSRSALHLHPRRIIASVGREFGRLGDLLGGRAPAVLALDDARHGGTVGDPFPGRALPGGGPRHDAADPSHSPPP